MKVNVGDRVRFTEESLEPDKYDTLGTYYDHWLQARGTVVKIWNPDDPETPAWSREYPVDVWWDHNHVLDPIGEGVGAKESELIVLESESA
jgi:hypothetical protein